MWRSIYAKTTKQTTHFMCVFLQNIIYSEITSHMVLIHTKNELTINTMEVCKLYNIIQISICLINKFCLKTGTNIAKWLSKMINICQSNSIGISFVWKKSSQLLLRWTYSLTRFYFKYKLDTFLSPNYILWKFKKSV